MRLDQVVQGHDKTKQKTDMKEEYKIKYNNLVSYKQPDASLRASQNTFSEISFYNLLNLPTIQCEFFIVNYSFNKPPFLTHIFDFQRKFTHDYDVNC